MSSLFSPDPAINRSKERPSVLCVAVIIASRSTLQHVCFLLLQEVLMDAKDPDLNVDAQKSVSY